jgi:hypothetical protein
MSTVQTESTLALATALANDTEPKIVFGARDIAPHLGKSEKGTYAALERAEKTGAEKIPGARKIGGTWALNLAVYHRAFEAA